MWYSLRINKYRIYQTTKKHYAGKNEKDDTRQCGSPLYPAEEPSSSRYETKIIRTFD